MRHAGETKTRQLRIAPPASPDIPSYRPPHKLYDTLFVFASKEAEQAGCITLSTHSLSFWYEPVHSLNLLFSFHIV
jgi:hypothetical protein